MTETITVSRTIRVKHGDTTVGKVIHQRKTLVLATARYTLAAGKIATFDLAPTKLGRRVLAQASASTPVHTTLVATAKGTKAATRAVVVS